MKAETRSPSVGALFNPSMVRFVEQSLDSLDYVAFIPDRGWIDGGVGSLERFKMFPQAEDLLLWVARQKPVVLHGIGMSICSAEFFDQEYALNLCDLAQRLDAAWISDHLSFSRVGTGHEVNSALPISVPYDREAMEMLVPRVRFITDRLGVPFLLENNVYYVKYADQDMSEEAFLNELSERAGSGVLLDLHNLYTNAVNHGFEATDYLDSLDLRTVTEIHIAGGAPMMGYHTDSHTGPVPEDVWKLLERTVGMATQLRGITFEFHESSYEMLGEGGIREQVEHARCIAQSVAA
jgi:uncharacterized protein (UPF0276 family)